MVRKYPSGLLHDLGEPQIVVRPSAKVVHGDDRDGPRMVEFGRGGAYEQTGASTRPSNRVSRNRRLRRDAIVVMQPTQHRPSYEPAIHEPLLGQLRIGVRDAVDALVDPRRIVPAGVLGCYGP